MEEDKDRNLFWNTVIYGVIFVGSLIAIDKVHPEKRGKLEKLTSPAVIQNKSLNENPIYSKAVNYAQKDSSYTAK